MRNLIVYGVRCTWWGNIEEAGKLSNGIPCCPQCGSVLFQIDKKEWHDGISKVEKEKPGYKDFVQWLHDCKMCFPSYDNAKKAYELRKQITETEKKLKEEISRWPR